MRALGEHECEVVAVATVQEEVGLRGARVATSRVVPDIGLAIDITLANDGPAAKAHERITELGAGAAIKVYDSSAIVPGEMVDHLVRVAASATSPTSSRSWCAWAPTRASAAAGGGAIDAAFDPDPHGHQGVETCHPDDIDACVRWSRLLRTAHVLWAALARRSLASHEGRYHRPCERILVLGSTGSIGVQALDVIAGAPDLVACGLACGGRAADMAAQAAAHGVRYTACLAGGGTIAHDPDLAALIEATRPDMVLNALVGAAGLRPTLAALERGIDVALANKESLVAGGDLVAAACRRSGARLVPVDSEHSALYQLMEGVPPRG